MHSVQPLSASVSNISCQFSSKLKVSAALPLKHVSYQNGVKDMLWILLMDGGVRGADLRHRVAPVPLAEAEQRHGEETRRLATPLPPPQHSMTTESVM
ncbi:hypothetical protein CDAR_615991 [Caerostris darwini]|uniref:Uncharacterized protein n=1 Tax=Caerostris darwini TaxID=1538125 RepID=A0AAV4RV70_9ARAC|nr:hypothetical protein CDAR_615991 [Caerostris darwini]